MEPVGGPPGRRWEGDPGLASALADGVAVLAPGGEVVWANEALGRLLGYEVDELIGMNAIEMTHPDEIARAIDGMVYASQFPGRTSVAPFRLQHGGGDWVDIELKSGLVAEPFDDHLVLVVRDGTSRQALNRALRSVASGESFEHTAGLVCSAVAQRWPKVGVAITFGGDGRQEILGHALCDPLLHHAGGAFADADVRSPWEVCTEPGTVAIVDRSQMAPALARLAEEQGFEGYAVSRVTDPAGSPCCLVVWFDHIIIASIEFRHAAGELSEVLSLALERRHASWQLSHLARHDHLTGLLNRVGFFEDFEAALSHRARSDWRMAVLYIDLDDLKEINDLHGHAAGDRVLVRTAQRLEAVAGADLMAARIGGDEFVIAGDLPGSTRDEAAAAAQALAEQIDTALSSPIDEDETEDGAAGTDDDAGEAAATVHRSSASIGIAVEEPGEGASRLLERADAAMYRAKAAGKSWWSM